VPVFAGLYMFLHSSDFVEQRKHLVRTARVVLQRIEECDLYLAEVELERLQIQESQLPAVVLSHADLSITQALRKKLDAMRARTGSKDSPNFLAIEQLGEAIKELKTMKLESSEKMDDWDNFEEGLAGVSRAPLRFVYETLTLVLDCERPLSQKTMSTLAELLPDIDENASTEVPVPARLYVIEAVEKTQDIWYMYSSSILRQMGKEDTPAVIQKTDQMITKYPYTHTPRLAFHENDQHLAQCMAAEYGRLAQLAVKDSPKKLLEFFSGAFNASDACAEARHKTLMEYAVKALHFNMFEHVPDITVDMSDEQKCNAYAYAFSSRIRVTIAKRLKIDPDNQQIQRQIEHSSDWSEEVTRQNFQEYILTTDWGKSLDINHLVSLVNCCFDNYILS